MIIGNAGTGSGTYNLGGGVLDGNGNDIVFGGSSGAKAFNFTGGTLLDVASTNFLLNQSGGIISPGASPGVTNLPSYSMAGGTYLAELLAASSADLINVSGTAALLGGSLDVAPLNTLAMGETYLIMTYGSLSGTFLGHADDTTFFEDGYMFLIDYDNGGNNVTLTVVPEPAALGMAAVGCALLLFVLLKRR